MNVLYQLRAEIEDSVRVRYCWFCSTGWAHHLWKHRRPRGSAQVINMHGNQYIFGRRERKNEKKHRKRAQALQCSSSFITLIYSLSLCSLCCGRAHTSLPVHAQTHTPVHTHTGSVPDTHKHAQQERRRERICPDQQIIHSFLCYHPCGAVQCVIASALLWRLAGLYICHSGSIMDTRE